MDNLKINSLFLETTNRCNLFCRHCYNNSGHCSPVDIDINLIIELLKDAKKLEVPKVCISGGEPLLNPHIERIFDFSKQAEMDILLITNGTLIEKHVQSIYNNPWISIQISIDGTQITHDMLRGVGTFEKTCANVAMLNQLKKKWALKCTITNYNKDDVEDIIKFGISNGAYIVSFSFLNIQGRTRDNQNIILSTRDMLDVCEKLSKLKIKYQDKIMLENPTLNCNNRCPFTNDEEEVSISPRVDVHGNVYFCSMVDNVLLSLGNIYQNNLIEILTGERSRDVFNFMNAYYKINTCRECFLNSVCQKGCPGAYFNNIPVYCDDFCNVRRMQFIRNFN